MSNDHNKILLDDELMNNVHNKWDIDSTRQTSLTLSGRLPEDNKQKGFLLYILCCLVIGINFSRPSFFENPVPPYDNIVAIWQHPAGKG